MPIQKVLSQFNPVKIWTDEVEESAEKQLLELSQLPFIHSHVAVMPDVHAGIGSTVGTVIPTKKAIIPAAVGVDIGCGMMALQTTLTSKDIPEKLGHVRAALERAVPHGFVSIPGRSADGSWISAPNSVVSRWTGLEQMYDRLVEKHGKLKTKHSPVRQLGTLGGGNHFIELCLDKEDKLWIMLHSGSRGVGNLIGRYFMEIAKRDMEKFYVHLPNQDLAYFVEDTEHFRDYWDAMQWAQDYAMENRKAMMESVLRVIRELFPPFQSARVAINCHHNYATLENHYGENVYVTRKGAVRARAGDLGIIPGSMGARSFIVRGLGNDESFHSCSHGAGRKMGRNQAKKTFSVEDLKAQTQGVECRTDEAVVDEIPAAYKDIDKVMADQSDLVEVVAELKQFLCVKG